MTVVQDSDLLFEDQFILAEDEALKNHLSGLLVSDGNKAARRVGVWYGQPDPEIRSQSYPYITIDLLDAIENRPQVMSGYGPISPNSYLLANVPINSEDEAPSIIYGLTPMLLVYQIATWSRMPRHDRALIAKLNALPLHPRFAQLTVQGQARRLVVTGFSKRDTTGPDDKRLFRNIWTIQIPSEIFYDPVTLSKRAQKVIINSDPTAPTDFPPPVFYP